MLKDKEIKHALFQANLHYYIFPFFHSNCENSSMKYTQLMAMEVLGEMVKDIDTETLKLLLSTELLDICMEILSKSRKMSKIVFN